MKHFDHPNVLGLIGICLNTPDCVPYIVLQYMANGDLRTFLKNKRAGRTSVNQLPKVCGATVTMVDEEAVVSVCGGDEGSIVSIV